MNYEELKRLVDTDISIRAIAKATGKSFTTVRHWLKKYSLDTKATRDTTYKQDTKKCPKCEECKPVSEYYIRRSGKLSGYCKVCMNQHTIKKKQDLKLLAVDYMGGKCQRCGYNKYVGALEFHHLDPTIKDFTIAHMSFHSFDQIKSELDKCVMLCSNCHREVHAGL